MEFNMANSLVVMVEGILIVFTVLVIIMGILYAMKLFAKEEPKAETKAAPKSAAPTVFTVSDKDPETLSDGEKIAIFSAAIAGYLDKPVKSISIASYKKID